MGQKVYEVQNTDSLINNKMKVVFLNKEICASHYPISLKEKSIKIIVFSLIGVGSVVISPYLLLIPTVSVVTHIIFCLANSFQKLYNGDFENDLEVWFNDISITGDKVKAKKALEEAYFEKKTSLDLSNVEPLPTFLFKHLTHLKSLDLSHNKLIEVPEQINQLTQLTSLNLSNNQLIVLPQQIGELVQLEELFLSHNKLTALPEQIGQLINLKGIYLSENQLTVLPEQIGKLVQLEELCLSHNKLTALPEQIKQQLIKLKFLSLTAHGSTYTT